MSGNTENDRKIQELNRFFGNALDRDVLSNILEMSNWEVSQAINFLQASNEQLNNENYYDPLQSEQDKLPKNYHQKPINWKVPPKKERNLSKSKKKAEEMKDLFFNENSTLLQHMEAQSSNEYWPTYLSVVLVLLHQRSVFQFHAKWKLIAASWAAHHYELGDYLLNETDQFNLPEVLKACKILDLQRKVRQMNKKIKKLQKAGAKKQTINKVKNKIVEIEKEMIPEDKFKTSVSGALSKRIRKWVGKFTSSELAFFSVQMPKKPWKELSDIVHFSPKDFQLDHFLPVQFGADPPKDSLIYICDKLNVNNVEESCRKFEIPYSFLRKNIPVLSNKVKELVANYEKIDTVIWYYEELTARDCKEVIDTILEKRLSNGELPTFNYGKLLERILYFKRNGSIFYEKLIPLAQQKLNEINLPLPTPFHIFGDASFSMDVSIRTSTIIASFVACITDAKLFFFNDKVVLPKKQPRSIKDVLDTALNTKADGLTAPGCILWDYYRKKKVVKTFLVVTDEIENVASEGMYFPQLFYKYYTEVYPAQLVLCSFLETPSLFDSGRMSQSLIQLGIKPIHFSLHRLRADLTKLDQLVSLLSLETEAFLNTVESVSEIAEKEGFKGALVAVTKPKRDISQEGEEKNEKEEEGEEDENEKMSKKKLGISYNQKEEEEKEKVPMPENVGEDGIPKDFKCPITCEVMKDPVIAEDGHNYERTAILKWFETKKTSPMTNQQLEQTNVFPNVQLRNQIQMWLEKNKKKEEN